MRHDQKLLEKEHNGRLDSEANAGISWNERRIEAGILAWKLWQWTGFSSKSGWDWLQLLAASAVPVVIFFAGQAIQERNQLIAAGDRRQEIEIATDAKNQEILSTYLEDMTKLLLDKSLRHSESHSEVQVVARIKTLNVARRLANDGESKGQILKFLYEADLIGKCQVKGQIKCGNRQNSILHLGDARLDQASVPSTALFPGIDLTEAWLPEATLTGIDLTNAQLQKANLREANLNGAILNDANLSIAVLNEASLSGTDMHRSVLRNASLEKADLKNAILMDANLSGAVLKSANLDGANLQNADLRNANLDGASLHNTDLKGAKYNSATQFPKTLSPFEVGMTLIQ